MHILEYCLIPEMYDDLLQAFRDHPRISQFLKIRQYQIFLNLTEEDGNALWERREPGRCPEQFRFGVECKNLRSLEGFQQIQQAAKRRGLTSDHGELFFQLFPPFGLAVVDWCPSVDMQLMALTLGMNICLLVES